jgi:hypothetical protein
MGATVLGCGHASQLFEINYLKDSPQVHLHFLTDKQEFLRQGYGRLELVCHACGAARLVLYDSSRTQEQHLEVRNVFWDEHRACQGPDYSESCPDYRSSHEVLDLRKKTPKVRKITIAKARTKVVG